MVGRDSFVPAVVAVDALKGEVRERLGLAPKLCQLVQGDAKFGPVALGGGVDTDGGGNL